MVKSYERKQNEPMNLILSSSHLKENKDTQNLASHKKAKNDY